MGMEGAAAEELVNWPRTLTGSRAVEKKNEVDRAYKKIAF